MQIADHRQIEARIDGHLAADPTQKLAGGEIVIDICEAHCIPVNLSRMTDELLVPPDHSSPHGCMDCLAKQQTSPAHP